MFSLKDRVETFSEKRKKNDLLKKIERLSVSGVNLYISSLNLTGGPTPVKRAEIAGHPNDLQFISVLFTILHGDFSFSAHFLLLCPILLLLFLFASFGDNTRA